MGDEEGTGAGPDDVDLEPAPIGGAALGCVKAVGLVALLSLFGCVAIVFVVGRILAPVGDVVGRFADGLGGHEDGEPRFFDDTDLSVGVGPGDGADSQRLPVSMAPSDGLADRDVVAVASDAFAAAEIVGVTTCLREVEDPGRSVADSCDLNEFATFAVPPSGGLLVPYQLRRVATVGADAFDCGAAPGRCVLLLTDMEAYRRSGFQPVSFTVGGPTPDVVPSAGPRPAGGLPATVVPTGPVAEGAELTITASGFVPGEPLQVSVCDDTFPSASATEACAELHDVNWYLGYGSADDGHQIGAPGRLRADGDGTATSVHRAAASFRPFGSGVGDLSDSEAPVVDCRARPARCSIVVAAAADPTRAAVVPYVLAAR